MDATELDSLRSTIVAAAMLAQSDPDSYARIYCEGVPFAAHCGLERNIREAAAFFIQRFPDNAERVEPMLKLLGPNASWTDLHDSIIAIDMISIVQLTVEAMQAKGALVPHPPAIPPDRLSRPVTAREVMEAVGEAKSNPSEWIKTSGIPHARLPNRKYAVDTAYVPKLKPAS